ncbi:MAG: hypothetical protein HYY13_12570 [Nitrospirae bacterium]|nr:hypothetical protein [Nitrospirota bacterium]
MNERAERLIVRRIRGRFPEHQIVAEEAGLSEAGRSPSRMQWFVDPLDGTTNYAHGYPVFCVSIALASNGRIHRAMRAILAKGREEAAP